MPLTASASATPTSGTRPLAVTFTGSASGGTAPYTYHWAFDTQGTSSTASPSFTFNANGTFACVLTVTDAVSATATASVSISVGGGGLFPDGEGPQQNDDGSYRPFTNAEIAAMAIQTTGVRERVHPTLSATPDTISIRRKYFVSADHEMSAIAHFIGAARRYDAGGGSHKLSRMLPMQDPEYSHLGAYCIQLEESVGSHGSGQDDADGVPRYTKKQLTFLFETVPFEMVDDADVDSRGGEQVRYVEERPGEIETKYLSLPGGYMTYINGGSDPQGKRIPYNIGFPQTEGNYSLKWWRVPYYAWGPGSSLYAKVYGDPSTGAKPYVGTVNKTSFFLHAPGTLMLLGVEEEIKKEMFPEGVVNVYYNLTFKFRKKPQGHNYFYYYDPLGGLNNGWFPVAKPGTSSYTPGSLSDDTSLFNEREFTDLFEV